MKANNSINILTFSIFNLQISETNPDENLQEMHPKVGEKDIICIERIDQRINDDFHEGMQEVQSEDNL